MYELLLKWGVDNLSKFTAIKGENELAVLREVIKTKNSIIFDRYQQCWSLNERLIDLVLEVEDELIIFAEEQEDLDNSWEKSRQFIGALKTEFHPLFYRKLCKIRALFEGTNDLLSAYTYTFLDLLQLDRMTAIAKKKQLYSKGSICRLYRGLWTKYSEVVSILIRVSSGDLRFWVTDTPYVVHADNWAKVDLELSVKFVQSNGWSNERFHMSLETKKGLDRFWYDLEEHHESNKLKSKEKNR